MYKNPKCLACNNSYFIIDVSGKILLRGRFLNLLVLEPVTSLFHRVGGSVKCYHNSWETFFFHIFALSNLICLGIQNWSLKIGWSFSMLNAVNFDRWTIFVGPVVPEIWQSGDKKKYNGISHFIFWSGLFFYYRRKNGPTNSKSLP